VRAGIGPPERYRSRIRVTGPSFTSDTSIIAPNSPVSTVKPALRQQRHEPLVEGDGDVGLRRLHEAGAAPLTRIAVKGELGDDEKAASHLLHRAVHLAVLVGEDAQPQHLLRHPRQLFVAIPLAEAGQQQEAVADLAGDLAIDADGSGGDALEDEAH
jgi:hypothetical protein